MNFGASSGPWIFSVNVERSLEFISILEIHLICGNVYESQRLF